LCSGIQSVEVINHSEISRDKQGRKEYGRDGIPNEKTEQGGVSQSKGLNTENYPSREYCPILRGFSQRKQKRKREKGRKERKKEHPTRIEEEIHESRKPAS